ncbi:unnamed protein product [Orchesella dallaii]|uniref:Uncharacterized protein n=1 Tax=Orchesella dallaii TaxID=48710 RepID=A0ABP1R679_9HEXA
MKEILHLVLTVFLLSLMDLTALASSEKFSMYWNSIFEIFSKDCTIHFEHHPISWSALHLSFHAMCSSSSYSRYCVSLITTQNGSLSRILAADSLSEIYNKSVFSCQKLQKVCVVQLPIVLLPLSSDQIYFTSIDNRGESFVRIFQGKQYVPDYVLLPLSSQQATIPAPKFLSSKLIVLIENGSSNPQNVFLGCLTCLQKPKKEDPIYMRIGGNYYSILNVSLKVISNEEFSLQKIDTVWYFLHNDMKDMGYTERAIITPTARSYSKLEQFFTCFDLLQYKYFEQRKCLTEILQKFHNCTHSFCGSLFNSISYGTLNRHQANGKYSKLDFISYGTEFHGAKYVIFVTSKMDGFLNIEALLSPLNFQIWIITLISFLALCTFLKLVEPQISYWFWLLSAFLEKSENVKDALGFKTLQLLIIWLFTTFLLRNLYTSAIYSHLTKKVEPSNIPGSYEELLKSTAFSIISDPCIPRNLPQCKRFDFYGIHKEIHEIWIRFCAKYLPETMKVLKYRDSSIPYGLLGRLDSHSPTSCQTHEMYDTRDCDQSQYWERFGLVYHTNSDQLGSGSWLPWLIPLFGGRSVIQNNEPTMVVQPFLWSTGLRTFFSRLILKRSLASLIESGIWMYYKNFRGILNLAQRIRKTCEVQGRTKNRIIYSLAATIYHSKSIKSCGTEQRCFPVKDTESNSTDREFGDRFKNTTVNQLGAVWALFVVLVSVCLFVMLAEIFVQYIYKI